MYLGSPSGGFKVVYEYTNRLQARGHQVTVVHPRNEDRQKGPFQFAKSRLWQYKMRFKHRPLIPWFDLDPSVKLMLVPDLREQFIPQADAIFATAFSTAFHLANYDASKGRKFYLIQSYETWHGSEERVRASWKLPLRKIVVSHWLEKIAGEMGEADRTAYISIGLDFSKFYLEKPLSKRTAPLVGMLAHPSENKGMCDGLKALEIVKAKIPHLQARLFGTHPRADAIPAWIEYEQQPTSDKLREIYNSCQVFLHPSWIEGWGLPAAEAMACGCALVSAANGGVDEFAVDGVNALLAPIKQPEILADKLLTCLTDRSLRIRLAESGERDIHRFSWDRAVVALEKELMK
jgi:glycosyltransferase involved in cell wall biosynthesis